MDHNNRNPAVTGEPMPMGMCPDRQSRRHVFRLLIVQPAFTYRAPTGTTLMLLNGEPLISLVLTTV